MEYVYVDFLRSLGYNVLEQFKPSTCAVFKVEQEGRIMVAKIGDQQYGGFPYQHVIREHEVLERAQGITGVPLEISFRTYQGTQPMAFLVKEYLEGKTLLEVPRALSVLQKNLLEAQVKEFHERGMVLLDIRAVNVLINPEGKPALIDFGGAYFKSGMSEFFFSYHQNQDLTDLQALFNQFQNI